MAEFEKDPFKFPDEQPVGQTDEKVEYEVEGDSEPEIEVVDDTPPEDRGRAPMKEPPPEVTDEELAQYSESVKKRIQHFSKGYHEERRAKEAALREREEALKLAQQIVEENKRLKGSVTQGQKVLLEQAKRAADTQVEEAKRKLKAAQEAFDTDAVIAATEELTTAKLQQETVVQQPATAQPAAPQVDPKARAWQDANPWFGQNEEMTAVALAVHKRLVGAGVDPNSDDYYDSINARVKQLFPDAFPSEKATKKSSVVAPATRSTAPKKIVLTKSQVNIAKRLGVPLDVYARQVAQEMRKQNG
jgi:hypothetical protein